MIEITPAKAERSPHTRSVLRTIPRQVYYFPDEINPQDYEVFGFLEGATIGKCKGLSKLHFDTIQFINKTTHPIKGGDFINAIGWRVKERTYSTLIMQRIH